MTRSYTDGVGVGSTITVLAMHSAFYVNSCDSDDSWSGAVMRAYGLKALFVYCARRESTHFCSWSQCMCMCPWAGQQKGWHPHRVEALRCAGELAARNGVGPLAPGP